MAGPGQLAVGLTHLGRGNRSGAATLLRRGRDRIARHGADGHPPHGVDVPRLVDWATAAADRLDAGGGDVVPPMPRLVIPRT